MVLFFSHRNMRAMGVGVGRQKRSLAATYRQVGKEFDFSFSPKTPWMQGHNQNSIFDAWNRFLILLKIFIKIHPFSIRLKSQPTHKGS